MSPSTCCFIRDSSKLTRFEHQMDIFSSLALRHFVSQCQWTFCGRRVVCGGTESLASGAIQVSQLPMTRKIHGLHSSPHSTKERTALRSEDLYVEEIQRDTRFDPCLALATHTPRKPQQQLYLIMSTSLPPTCVLKLVPALQIPSKTCTTLQPHFSSRAGTSLASVKPTTRMHDCGGLVLVK